MFFETVETVSDVGTALFVIVAAIAAIAQLQHLEAGNRLRAMLAIERGFAQDDIQSALLFVQNELPAKLTERVYREGLVHRGFIDIRLHPEMIACNWFNDIGVMVAGGIADERLVFASFGRLIEYYWTLLAPTIALLRRERGSDQYAYFEYLTARARRWAATA